MITSCCPKPSRWQKATCEEGRELAPWSGKGDSLAVVTAGYKFGTTRTCQAVEFAGYHKYSGDPKGLRKQLDACGLKVAGTHIGAGSLTGDALPKSSTKSSRAGR